jgi:hypothetical protein
MPKVSKETASETIALEGLEVQLEHLDGGYSVCFESHTADADLADLFRGLPDDRSQLPRWGYVIKGKVAFRFADREETYAAGDAYYVPPRISRSPPAGYVRFNMIRSVENPDEVVCFGFFDGSVDELRRTVDKRGYAEQLEAIAPFVESVGADGLVRDRRGLHGCAEHGRLTSGSTVKRR